VKCKIDRFILLSFKDTTFVEGLKPILKRLSQSQLISVIIPSRLATTRTSLGKAFELRVCVDNSGYKEGNHYSHSNRIGGVHGSCLPGPRTSHKVLARKGNQVQEVYFVTDDAAFARAYPYPSSQKKENAAVGVIERRFALHLKDMLSGEKCAVKGT
jgi:hypothetical protein